MPRSQTRMSREYEEHAAVLNSLFAPISNGMPSVGSEITKRNPDVEIMAMTLNDTPLTLDGFNSLEGGRGWYSIKFIVLMVGPPGFSSVPYTASKKGGEKEVGKKLYDATDTGQTRFFSYMKGKTNKDRGERMSVFSADDIVDGNVTATLVPGMCLTQFVRSDVFEKEFVVGSVNTAVLSAYNIVYMQLSSSNCEQAIKGRLIKLRKMKVAAAPSLWQRIMFKLPASPSEFRIANSVESDTNFSIRENIDSRMNSTFYQFPVDKTAFLMKEDDAVVVCEPTESIKEASIGFGILDDILPNAEIDQRIKFLNMAISTGSVRMFCKSLNQEDSFIMDTSLDKYPDKIIGIDIDYNVMFGIDVLANIDFNTIDMNSGKAFAVDAMDAGIGKKIWLAWKDKEDLLLWWKGDTWGAAANPTKCSNSIAFSVKTGIIENMDAQGLSETRSCLDRNASGPFFRIRMHMLGTATLDEFRDKLSSNENEKCLMTVELRVENRGVSGGQKRKRPTLDFEMECE